MNENQVNKTINKMDFKVIKIDNQNNSGCETYNKIVKNGKKMAKKCKKVKNFNKFLYSNEILTKNDVQIFKNIELLKDERLDDLQYKNLHLIQNKNMYCFSSDAVLLCNFVKAKKSDTIVDLCSGSGIVGILAQAKTNASNLIMIEKQPELVDMCERSLQFNGLTSKAKVFCCDIEKAGEILKTHYNKNNVEVVCCNPPYYLPVQKKLSGNKQIDIAKFEIELNFDKLCNVVSSILTFGGKFYMVNDSERIAEILSTLKKYKLEPKILEFVYPKETVSSNVVLLQATKCGKPGTKVYYKNV